MISPPFSTAFFTFFLEKIVIFLSFLAFDSLQEATSAFLKKFV